MPARKRSASKPSAELPQYWSADIDPDDAKALEERAHQLAQAVPILRLLASRLQSELHAVQADRMKQPEYDSAGWAYRQADLNAKERTVKHLLDRVQEVCYNAAS